MPGSPRWCSPSRPARSMRSRIGAASAAPSADGTPGAAAPTASSHAAWIPHRVALTRETCWRRPSSGACHRYAHQRPPRLLQGPVHGVLSQQRRQPAQPALRHPYRRAEWRRGVLPHLPDEGGRSGDRFARSDPARTVRIRPRALAVRWGCAMVVADLSALRIPLARCMASASPSRP